MAKKYIASFPERVRILVVSQTVAAILLNFQAYRVETFKKEGFLSERQATELFKQTSREFIVLQYYSRGSCSENSPHCQTDAEAIERHTTTQGPSMNGTEKSSCKA